MNEVMQARQRAHNLLVSYLDDDQKRSLKHHGYCKVVGSEGGVYRIGYTHQSEQVLKVDRDQPRKRDWNYSLCGDSYCVLAMQGIPMADKLLSIILMLRADEQRFLATAYRARFLEAYEIKRWFTPVASGDYAYVPSDSVDPGRWTRLERWLDRWFPRAMVAMLILICVAMMVAYLEW